MMYSVKPLYDVSQSVVLSDVMYKVTPIQGAASTEYNNSKASLNIVGHFMCNLYVLVYFV